MSRHGVPWAGGPIGGRVCSRLPPTAVGDAAPVPAGPIARGRITRFVVHPLVAGAVEESVEFAALRAVRLNHLSLFEFNWWIYETAVRVLAV
eukprot:1011283-Alexandrium_andersonii.AAC.1